MTNILSRAQALDYERILILVVGNSKKPYTDVDELSSVLQTIPEIESIALMAEQNFHIHGVITLKDAQSCDYWHSLVAPKKPKRLTNLLLEKIEYLKSSTKSLQQIRFDLDQYKELTEEEQKYFQVVYCFKDFDRELHHNYKLNQVSIEQAEQYSRDYWELHKRINQIKMISKKDAQKKSRTLREKCIEYFQEHRPKKTKVTGEKVNAYVSVKDIVDIVDNWYSSIGIEHSLSEVERKVFMILGMANPQLKKNLMHEHFSKKFNY